MPELPKRPCAGGCGVLVASGWCPACQRNREQQRGTATARGYDADHRRLRVLCFERDDWKCVDCGWEPELVKRFREAGAPVPSRNAVLADLRAAFNRGARHLHADHEIPIEQRPDLRLSLANLRTRCNVCHSAKTAREDGGFDGVRRNARAAEPAKADEVFSF